MQEAGVQTLLDRLRSKSKSSAQQQLSWADFGRQMRMATLEHKAQRNMPVVQQSLEKLQGIMRATALSDVLERIESLCRQLKLQYVQRNTSVFISSDAFYIEIQCDLDSTTDFVKEVKVAHGNNAIACPHMTDVLKKCDFIGFQEHLKGFLDMYSIVGDKAVKRKFFIVLQSLESDINNLAQVQSGFSTNYQALVYRYPLGIYTPRKDGLPLRLTYFVTPYDLLNEETKESLPFNIDVIRERGIGHSATVGIEQSSTHQLQTIPLMTTNRNAEGKQMPLFAALTSVNSVALAAVFVLKLNKPMAVTKELLSRIESVTAISFMEKLELRPFMDIVCNSTTKERLLHVSLPGQEHCYLVNEPADDALRLGALVHKIPFTHPTHVPKVLTVLRQQAALNSALLSCVRPIVKQEAVSSRRLEMTVISMSLINVTFENPLEQSLATVEFDMSELVHLKCRVSSSGPRVCQDDYASKTFQRTFSIPITMRDILKNDHIKMEIRDEPPFSTSRMKRQSGAATGINQQLVDYYVARGHYMPYGSLNTVSTAYTKNIQSNQYSLCLRRFAGYRRRLLPRSAVPFRLLVSHCNASDNILLGSCTAGGSIPAGSSSTGSVLRARSSLPAGSSHMTDEENKASKNPMLASLLDEDLGRRGQSAAGHFAHQHAPILTDLLEGSEAVAGDSSTDPQHHQLHPSTTLTKKAAAPRKRRPTAESSGGSAVSSKRRKKSEGTSTTDVTLSKDAMAAGIRQQPAVAAGDSKSPVATTPKPAIATVRPPFLPTPKSSTGPILKMAVPCAPGQASGNQNLSRSSLSSVSNNPGLANLLNHDTERASIDVTTVGEASNQAGSLGGCSNGGGYLSNTNNASCSGRDRPPLRRSSSLVSEPEMTTSSGNSRDAVFDEKAQSLPSREERVSTKDDRVDATTIDDDVPDKPETKPQAVKEKANITVKISRQKERRSTDEKINVADRMQSMVDVPRLEKKHKASNKLTITTAVVDPDSSRKMRESHSLEIIKMPSSPTKKVDRIKITKTKAKSATSSLAPGEFKHKAPKKVSSDSKSKGHLNNSFLGNSDKRTQGDEMGPKDFYRATNLSALPKIPKRKPDAQQMPADVKTPTSPSASKDGTQLVAVGAKFGPQSVSSVPAAAAASAVSMAPVAPRSMASSFTLAATASAHQTPPPPTASRPALLPTPPSPTLSPGNGQSRGTAARLQLPASSSSSTSHSPAVALSLAMTTPLLTKQRSLNAVIDKLTSKTNTRPDESSPGRGSTSESAPANNRASPVAAGGLTGISYSGSLPKPPPLHLAATARQQSPASTARLPPPLLTPARPPTAASKPASFAVQRQNSGGGGSAIAKSETVTTVSAMLPPYVKQITIPAGRGSFTSSSSAVATSRAATASPPNGKTSRAAPLSPDEGTGAGARLPLLIPTEVTTVGDGADPSSPQPQPFAELGRPRAIPLEETPQQFPPALLHSSRNKSTRGIPHNSVDPPASAVPRVPSSATKVARHSPKNSNTADGISDSLSSPSCSDSPASSLDLIIHDPDDEQEQSSGKHSSSEHARVSNRQSSANGLDTNLHVVSSPSPAESPADVANSSIDDELMDAAISCDTRDTSITF